MYVHIHGIKKHENREIWESQGPSSTAKSHLVLLLQFKIRGLNLILNVATVAPLDS